MKCECGYEYSGIRITHEDIDAQEKLSGKMKKRLHEQIDLLPQKFGCPVCELEGRGYVEMQEVS